MSRMRALRVLGPTMLALAVVAVSAAAEGATDRAGGYWVVVVSDRDGESRGYSVRPDGSRVTPLLPASRALAPWLISRDGRTLAYEDLYDRYGGGIFVSRANGTGLRSLVRDGGLGALSSDGKQLAFTYGDPSRIAVIGTDGSRRRDVSSNRRDEIAGWSPDGKALLFWTKIDDTRAAVVVQSLTGSRRELVRAVGLGPPRWSPSGRWIAYEVYERPRDGLYIVQPNGARRHRIVRGSISWFSWSPDGRTLAVLRDSKGQVALIGVGGGSRLLPGRGVNTARLVWSPDGRLVTITPRAAGDFGIVGVTRLAPTRAPAGPLLASERLVDARSVATRRPITDLSADGGRVALAVATRTAVDCDHVVVWTPANRGLRRFGRPARCQPYNNAGEIYDVELAGSRAAWASDESCGNYCDVGLRTATLGETRPVTLSYLTGVVGSSDTPWDHYLRGHGDLLVFDDRSGPGDGARLVRIGSGRGACAERSETTANICTSISSGAHACCADSVAGGLVAVREPDAVSVLDSKGALVRSFPFGRGQVVAARLDGERLVVARARVLEVYEVQTGAGVLQRPLPTGFGLADVDGGIAVLRSGTTVTLLRLADGRSLTLKPGLQPVSAELESAGLYYAYATADGGGRAVFVPRAEVEQRLAGSTS